jgi:hypothetical protein
MNRAVDRVGSDLEYKLKTGVCLDCKLDLHKRRVIHAVFIADTVT